MATTKEHKSEQHSKKEAEIKGRDISTAGFAVAIASIFTNLFTLGLTAVVGLVLSIIGRVQTSRAGHPSPLALAGIIISGAVMALTFMLFMFFVVLVLLAASRDGYGPHDMNCEEGQQGFGWECQVPGEDAPLFNYPHTRS